METPARTVTAPTPATAAPTLAASPVFGSPFDAAFLPSCPFAPPSPEASVGVAGVSGVQGVEACQLQRPTNAGAAPSTFTEAAS